MIMEGALDESGQIILLCLGSDAVTLWIWLVRAPQAPNRAAGRGGRTQGAVPWAVAAVSGHRLGRD